MTMFLYNSFSILLCFQYFNPKRTLEEKFRITNSKKEDKSMSPVFPHS